MRDLHVAVSFLDTDTVWVRIYGVDIQPNEDYEERWIDEVESIRKLWHNHVHKACDQHNPVKADYDLLHDWLGTYKEPDPLHVVNELTHDRKVEELTNDY